MGLTCIQKARSLGLLIIVKIRVKLTSFKVLREQTDFYLNEANDRIPLDCLGGATPAEIISGSWTEKEIERLELKAMEAKRERLVTNRAQSCPTCR